MISVIALVYAAMASACALDAPRGGPPESIGTFGIAATNFAKLRTVRVYIERGDGAAAVAEVELPSRLRVRTQDSQWLASGDVVRRVAGDAASGTWPVDLGRESVAVALGLGRATNARHEGEVVIDAVSAHVWTFDLDGTPGRVWLMTRDALPRRLELGAGSTKRAFVYRDYDARIVVPKP